MLLKSIVASFVACLLLASAVFVPARAQDLWQYIDLNSDAFTKADVSRADVETAIKAAGAAGGVDFSGKQLNRLDLSGLDLHGANVCVSNGVIHAALLERLDAALRAGAG